MLGVVTKRLQQREFTFNDEVLVAVVVTKDPSISACELKTVPAHLVPRLSSSAPLSSYQGKSLAPRERRPAHLIL